MRTLAVAVSAGVFAASLAVPSLLLAQEPEAAPPPAEAPPAEAPPAEVPPPPAGEAPPPAEAPAPAESTVATQAPAATAAVSPAKASTSVSMVDYSYSPSSVTISVGDTITWINNGQEDHTATGSGFDTGTVAPGGSGSATFSSAGSFPYVCSFHPNMKGTVIVSDPGGTDAGSTGGTDPDTGAPLGSEAAAAAAPGAAGSADALPASGEAEAPLLILGAGLLGCGLLATVLARWRAGETALWPGA